MFVSLSVRNYRLYFVGMLLSNIGLWMSRVAQDWLVLTVLTDHSSTALGVITGLQFLPIALLAPSAGALADRIPKRRLLLITQSAAALVWGVMALLTFLGVIQLWQVYALATASGVVAAVDNPTRQAFASEMVPDAYLTNAVGLNSTTFNASRLVGPGLAGLAIAALGIAPVIALNALSYVATLVALLLMNPAELHPAPLSRGRGSVRAGLAYVAHRPDIVLILFLVFMLGTFGLNFQVTNALMATIVFGVGSEQYGLMGTIMGIGTLGAALLAARRQSPRNLIIVAALGGFALFTALLAAAPTYVWYLVLLVPVGLTSLTVMTAANASVQLSTTPAMRGRVMALYMAIFMGGTPIGAPVIGWIGDAYGPRAALGIGAAATGIAFVVAVLFLLRRRHWRLPPLVVRHDYTQEV